MMRKEYNILIDEMINFVEKFAFPNKHLKKANKEMDKIRFTISVTRLLNWIKTTSNHQDTSDFYLDTEYDKINYALLFKYSKKLNELFTLKEREIIWNSDLTDNQKNEIIIYVNSKYTPKLRVNRTLRNTKD